MITLGEIAAKAGVSITTVSNVLHGNTKKVSKATTEKVTALLKEGNYVPRMGWIASPNSRIIGVVINIDKHYEYTFTGSFFYGQIIGSLEKRIRNAGRFMMLYSSDKLDEIYRMAASWNVDGLVAISFSHKNYLRLKSLIAKPVVAVDLIHIEGSEYYNVGLNDEGASWEMTTHLIAKGRKGIVFLSNSDWGIDLQRKLGWQRALSEAGHPQGRHEIIGTLRKDRMQKYEALLSDSDIGSAWYFSADSFAIEALGFLASKNISVPGHIAVAGFDDEPYSEMSCPPLTTTRQDVPRKGSVAFELLLELMAGKTPAANDVRLPVALVDRQSV